MATMMRNTILPTVKCSDCGDDIEISRMGDHVCANRDVSQVAPYESASLFGNGVQYDRQTSKPGKTAPPPRIDPWAANKPFLEPSVFVPSPRFNKAKESLPISPISPRGTNRAHPSPSFNTNYREFETPFSPLLPPSRGYASPKTSSKRSTNTSSPQSARIHKALPTLPSSPKLSRSRTFSNDDEAPNPFTRKLNGSSLKQRMDAAPSEPSGTKSSRNLKTERPPFGGDLATAPTEDRTGGVGGVSQWLARTGQSYDDRPPPPEKPGYSHSMTRSLSSNAFQREVPVDQGFSKPNRYDDREAGSSSAMGSLFSNKHERGRSASPRASPRVAAGHQSTDILFTLSPTVYQPGSEEPSRGRTHGLRLETATSQRSTSRSRSNLRSELRRPSSPSPFVFPPPKQQSGKSLHTPTDSYSSEASMTGSEYRSITTSPATSATSSTSRRLSSSSSQDDQKGLWWKRPGQHTRSASKSPRAAVAFPRSHDEPDRPTAGLETLPSTRYGESDGRETLSPHSLPPLSYGDSIFGQSLPPHSASPRSVPAPLERDSEPRSDPAVQMGLWNWKQRLQSDAAATSFPSSVSSSRTASPTPPPKDYRPTQRPTPVSKGKCRGCDQDILGKSVKAADGRLTGRYHKQCFVCTTCLSPFSSTSFYVHGNKPYCERHYHQLNGSLCTACDLGIEGQFIETEAQQKFHRWCFNCTTCRTVLHDDYFEVDGRVYCEQDALKASAASRLDLGNGAFGGSLTGSRNMERRRTRMMMM